MMVGVVTIMSSPSNSQTSRDQVYEDLSLFGEVFESIRNNYVEPVEDKELIHSAINGMLTSLDPHSSFLTADDFDQMQERTKGEFGGLGIEITMEDGFVKVVSPIDDTPAARAGIISGDLIIGIDGQNVLGMTLTEAVDLMRGKIGSEITVTIKRGDKAPFDITLERDVIKMRSVRSDSYGHVGYIRITNFTEQTTPGLLKAMTDLREEHGTKLIGVVLDLRNNPGGLLSEAISVTDAFLDQGEIVSTRGRNESSASRYFAREGDISNGMPIVVLINSGSASASEIVAGALKDHERALIMGTRSFGKGSVQSIVPIGRDAAMRITTARYYTPSGVSIQGTGITPDIIVELAIVENIDDGAFREEDLKGSLENQDVTELPSEEELADNTDNDEEKGIKDYQLARAVDLLNGLKVFKGVMQ
ncbi:MAG: S41 family peptidase [Alphaproteobacteria bacterium]|nr:S41 family peptidase [Alphaproteobacteria bacterium]